MCEGGGGLGVVCEGGGGGPRAVVVLLLSLSRSRATESELVLEESISELESGDFVRVGEVGGSGCAETPRVVSHERSPEGLLLVGRSDDCGPGNDVVEFFNGDD